MVSSRTEVASTSAGAHRHCAPVKVNPETSLCARLPDAKLYARVQAGCGVSPGWKVGSQNLALSLIHYVTFGKHVHFSGPPFLPTYVSLSYLPPHILKCDKNRTLVVC